MVSVVEEISREFMLIARYEHMERKECAPPALERSAFLLLSRLDAGGPQSIGQLAAAFHLDTSTVNRQVAAVVRHGHAERIPDPDGGVARKLRLTEQGAKALASDRARYVAAVENTIGDWPEEDRRVFLDLLTRFNRAVEERRGMQWPR